MSLNTAGQRVSESPELADVSLRTISLKTFTITSLIAGFFLIPLHELGHVVCDWITGHPAAMSYARDYLLSGEKTPFLGLLGGPLLPLILSAVSVILIYRGTHLSVFYPLAVLGTFDRLLLYLSGSTPSDERELAQAIAWPATAFKHIFLGAEILLLALVILSLIRHKAGIRRSVLIFVIPLASFVVCASFGVFVIDRFLFPEQHKKEFGLTHPSRVRDSSREARNRLEVDSCRNQPAAGIEGHGVKERSWNYQIGVNALFVLPFHNWALTEAVYSRSDDPFPSPAPFLIELPACSITVSPNVSS